MDFDFLPVIGLVLLRVFVHVVSEARLVLLNVVLEELEAQVAGTTAQ